MDIAPGEAERLDAKAARLAGEILGLDVHERQYQRLLDEISTLGAREVTATTEMMKRLPARADPAADLADDFRDLKQHINDGGGRSLRHVAELVRDLEARADGLRAQNASMDQTRIAFGVEIEALRKPAFLAERLEARLADHGEDRTDVLYEVRRRRQEVLAHLAVTLQARAALDVLVRNNQELIRAIRGVATTTASALRAAEAVSGALTQRAEWGVALTALDRAETMRRKSAPNEDNHSAQPAGGIKP